MLINNPERNDNKDESFESSNLGTQYKATNIFKRREFLLS
jgi:hypothetical protein